MLRVILLAIFSIGYFQIQEINAGKTDHWITYIYLQ